MLPVATYQFHVKSSKRSSGTETDLNIKMNQILSLKSANGVFRVKVEATTIPFSFYQLSSDINTLQVELTSGGSKTVNLTLTPGNYTTASVLNLLKDQIVATAALSSGGFIGYAANLVFTYSAATGRSTLATTDVGKSIVLRFDLNQDLGRFFGFETSQTISSISTPVSTKIAVANPVYQLYIRSGNLQQINNREFITETDVYSDIFYTIPIATNTNTYIQTSHEGDEIWVANNDISEINWYLTTNLSYTQNDLQGLDWSFVFVIDEIERPDYRPRTAAINTLLQTPIPKPVDTDALQRQKEELLSKLEVYKKKLSKGLPEDLLKSFFSEPGTTLDLPTAKEKEEKKVPKSEARETPKTREEVLASLKDVLPETVGSRLGFEPQPIQSIF